MNINSNNSTSFLTDPRKLNRQQLRARCAALANEHGGWSKAKALDPDGSFQALAQLPPPPDTASTDGVMDASRAAIPQPAQDDQGLYAGAGMDELSAVWKQCGNSYDPARADVGFDALCDLASRKPGATNQTAQQSIRTRFKSLATQRDSIVAARKLGVNLPLTTNGNGTQRLSAPSAASTAPGRQRPQVMDASRLANPFPVAGVLGNDMSHSDVVDTYCQVLGKHMKLTGETSPAKAGQAIAAAHPALVKSLRTHKKGKQTTDASDADDSEEGETGSGSDDAANTATATANSRVLANSTTALANSSDDETLYSASDLSKPFARRHNGGPWVVL